MTTSYIPWPNLFSAASSPSRIQCQSLSVTHGRALESIGTLVEIVLLLAGWLSLIVHVDRRNEFVVGKVMCNPVVRWRYIERYGAARGLSSKLYTHETLHMRPIELCFEQGMYAIIARSCCLLSLVYHKLHHSEKREGISLESPCS